MENTIQKTSDQPEIFNYSHADMTSDLKQVVDQMNEAKYRPDYILGLTRGGLFPAVMLSHYFGVPLIPINFSLRDFKSDTNFVQEQIRTTVGKHVLLTKNLLVVDDIVDTGDTLHELVVMFNRIKNTVKSDNIKYAALFNNTTNAAKFKPDFYARAIDKQKDNQWIVFNSFEDWWK